MRTVLKSHFSKGQQTLSREKHNERTKLYFPSLSVQWNVVRFVKSEDTHYSPEASQGGVLVTARAVGIEPTGGAIVADVWTSAVGKKDILSSKTNSQGSVSVNAYWSVCCVHNTTSPYAD